MVGGGGDVCGGDVWGGEVCGGDVCGGDVGGGAVTTAVVGTNAVAGIVVVGGVVDTGTDVMIVMPAIDGGGLSMFRPCPQAVSTSAAVGNARARGTRDDLVMTPMLRG